MTQSHIIEILCETVKKKVATKTADKVTMMIMLTYLRNLKCFITLQVSQCQDQTKKTKQCRSSHTDKNSMGTTAMLTSF